MRERGISTIGAVLLAATGGLLVAFMLTDWMVVDVRTGPPDDVHVVVPFPLWAARLASAAVPNGELPRLDTTLDAHVDRAALLDALSALEEAGDATLVEVREPGTEVRVRTEDGHLVVDVDEGDATVRCRLPLEGARRALERWDGETLDPRMAFDLLRGAGDGDLVRVEDGPTRVTIRIW